MTYCCNCGHCNAFLIVVHRSPQAVSQLQEQLKKKTEQRPLAFTRNWACSSCSMLIPKLFEDTIYQEIQPCKPESEGACAILLKTVDVSFWWLSYAFVHCSDLREFVLSNCPVWRQRQRLKHQATKGEEACWFNALISCSQRVYDILWPEVWHALSYSKTARYGLIGTT